MNEHPAKVELIRLPLGTIAEVYAALAKSISEMGLEKEGKRILEDRLEAECVMCGMRITGPEIAQIATANDRSQLAQPKLQRLYQQWCGRKGCDSLYYVFHFRPDPRLDWARVIGSIDPGSMRLFSDPLQARSAFLPRFNGRRSMWILGAAAVGIILVFLLRHWAYGYRIPLLQKPHHYITNPDPFRHKSH